MDLFIPRDTNKSESISPTNHELPTALEDIGSSEVAQIEHNNVKTTLQKNDQPNLKMCRPVRMKTQPSYLKDYKCNTSTTTHWCNLIHYHARSSIHKKIAQNHNEYVEPRSYNKALLNPQWVEAMNRELKALDDNETWEIVSLPHEKKPIGNR